MFKKLTDFRYKRTGREAFGFYVAYLILLLVIGAILGGIAGAFSPSNAHDFGLNIGEIVAIIGPTLLVIIILEKKGLFRSFKYILLGLVAILLSLFGGIIGLILVAYLTTIQPVEIYSER